MARFVQSWLRAFPSLTRACQRGSATATRKQARRVRLGVEGLETRLALATWTTIPGIDVSTPCTLVFSTSPQSLRDAINCSAPGDIIQMPGGSYPIYLAGTGEDLGLTGDFDIRHPLTLQAFPLGSCGTVFVEGNWYDRVFDVHPSAGLIMTGLTVRTGWVIDDGGGIRNRARLNFLGCNEVTFNLAWDFGSGSSNGGGIANLGPTAIMSTLHPGAVGTTFIHDNYAKTNGGGLYNSQGIVTLDRALFQYNYGLVGGAIYNISGNMRVDQTHLDTNWADWAGAGIYTWAGQLGIERSTFSGNYAYNSSVGNGGGLYTNTPTTVVVNSTFSGNYAGVNGGGIHVDVAGGLQLRHVTVTLNGALSGGGVYVNPFATGPLLNNTLVAQNFNWFSAWDDVRGVLNATGRNNLIGDGTGMTGLVNSVLGNQVGTFTSPINPQLGPLANNGGLTPTHALLSTSPAVNAGDPAWGLPLDQRGSARPSGSGFDIGAFEL